METGECVTERQTQTAERQTSDLGDPSFSPRDYCRCSRNRIKVSSQLSTRCLLTDDNVTLTLRVYALRYPYRYHIRWVGIYIITDSEQRAARGRS